MRGHATGDLFVHQGDRNPDREGALRGTVGRRFSGHGHEIRCGAFQLTPGEGQADGAPRSHQRLVEGPSGIQVQYYLLTGRGTRSSRVLRNVLRTIRI